MESFYEGPGEHGYPDWLIHPDLAATYVKNSSTDGKPFYPSGVTGQHYFPHTWPTLDSTPTHVRLEPQPENKHDCCALKVMNNDRQIGWVRAGISRSLAPFVHLLVARGSKCLVPLTPPDGGPLLDQDTGEIIEHIQIGAMLLPKFSHLWSLFTPTELFADLDTAWRLLKSPSAAEKKFTYDLDRFTHIGREFTNYPFTLPADYDYILEQYFHWYRRKIFNLAKTRSIAERNIFICDALAKGCSHETIADEIGLAKSTIGQIRSSGKKPEVLNEWRETVASIPGDEGELSKLVIKEFFTDWLLLLEGSESPARD